MVAKGNSVMTARNDRLRSLRLSLILLY